MKTAFFRIAVMTLAFAGFVAPSVAKNAPAKTVTPVKALSTSSSFVGMPAPMCLPSSGQTCGMD